MRAPQDIGTCRPHPVRVDDAWLAGIADLEAQYPNWNIYVTRHPDGSPAALMATRRRHLTQAELDAGLALTLPMGFFGDLRAQLAEQERAGTRPPGAGAVNVGAAPARRGVAVRAASRPAGSRPDTRTRATPPPPPGRAGVPGRRRRAGPCGCVAPVSAGRTTRACGGRP